MRQFVMHGGVCLAVLGVLWGVAQAAEPTLFSISPFDELLREIDPADGSILSDVTLTRAGGGEVCGGNGLATDPTTGRLWGLLKSGDCAADPTRTNFAGCPIDACQNISDEPTCEISWQIGNNGVAACFFDESCRACGPSREAAGDCINTCRGASGVGRELATIDPALGVATSIGGTEDKFAGITFDAAGTLYGVTGDGAKTSESLFTLSTADATPSFLTGLGNGDDGETIAFNPEDGLLYHASGIGTQNVDEIFETIDPATLTVTNLPLSGDDYEEATALTFGASFLLADLNGELFEVTSAGEVTFIGDMGHTSKGLAFVSPVAPTIAAIEALRADTEAAGIPDPRGTKLVKDLNKALENMADGQVELDAGEPTKAKQKFILARGFLINYQETLADLGLSGGALDLAADAIIADLDALIAS